MSFRNISAVFLRLSLIAGACLLTTFQQAWAVDHLVFENGDRITGTYLGRTDSLIYFESHYLGTLRVPAGSVELILAPPPEPEPLPIPTVQQVEPPTVPKDTELTPVVEETPFEEDLGVGLNALWETAEKTLNSIIHDRVPSWFPSLPDDWSGELKLGLNITNAVSASTRYHGEFKLEGDKPRFNYFFRSHFAYTKLDQNRSEDDWGLSGRLRYKIRSGDFFETFGSHDVDNLFDPRRRSTVSLGFGIKPITRESFQLDLVAGGAFEQSELRIGDTNNSFKININENLRWPFNRHMTFRQSIRFYIQPDDDWDFHFRFESGLDTMIIGAFVLSMSYRLDYDSAIPKDAGRQRTRFITSVGVRF